MLLNRYQNLIKSNSLVNLGILRKCLWNLPAKAELDVNYLCNENNVMAIENNISHRKGIGDIKLVNILKKKLESLSFKDTDYEHIQNQLYTEMLKIPNHTHPSVINYKDSPKVLKTIGNKKSFNGKKPLEFDEITKRLKLARTDQLGNVSGSKSYYILGELAELEQALIRYVVSSLLRHNFQLISVPDILHRQIIEGCGMNTRGTRTQIYGLDSRLHGPDLCLSGTSEMAIAGFLMNKIITENQLPLKFAAISRCYRAETSNVADERGIYRVHEFTKVEMFVVSTPDKSDYLLEELREIQEQNFAELGLHFLVLDMPPHELGAQAYRKYDVETWLSGRGIYGEISSCSNCTDYQARRLGIKYSSTNGQDFVHTLNGTACAIPRLLIALIEDGQNPKGTISVPAVLQQYMRGKTVIGKQKKIADLRLIKHKK